MLDEPGRPPNLPDSRRPTDSFAAWLRQLSDQDERGNSVWPSPRVRNVLTTVLWLLLVLSMAFTWIAWTDP